ncbi:hypothetical protein [uncultured Winogradskyella sp.]|uniref:hypothetical protein n=1 Tax=uncultured Winogradskyella sp. TaxID=395353 RepID=UPI00260FEBFE|nr:hypothetical protein [uncultured Winogradskyella sp.]
MYSVYNKENNISIGWFKYKKDALKKLSSARRKYPRDTFYIKSDINPYSMRINSGSKNRVSTKAKRKALYRWAWRQKGKGSLSRIGKKMKSLKRSGGRGSSIAIKQLSIISAQKKSFLKGRATCKKRY